MDESNTEVEEGEACYYGAGGAGVDSNIDPDIDLSYIDEKIQNVLGHFQKDFEGGVTAENLGAKFGGYGSFLPAYERSNPIRSHPRTPSRNKIMAKSPNHSSTEGVHFKAQAAVSPLGKPGTASGAPTLHNSKVPPNDPLKQDLAYCSELVTNCIMKEEISNKPGNQSDQRTLKVRIKVGCDRNAQKNAAIYSGLGLDNSPSSSSESSSGESEDLSASSGEISEVSPASILQVMTSFPFADVGLISPLHENLLSLTRKEKFFEASKPFQSLTGSRKDVAILEDHSVILPVDKELSKGIKTILDNRNESLMQQRYEVGIDFDANKTISVKKKLKNGMVDGKQTFSGNVKKMPLADSSNAGDVERPASKPSENLQLNRKDKAKGRSITVSAKDLSLKPITSQENGAQMQNGRNSLTEKSQECGPVNSLNEVSGQPKVNGAVERARWDAVQDAAFDKQTDTDISHHKEMPVMEVKKNSKDLESNGRAADLTSTERPKVADGAGVKDKKGTSNASRPAKKKKFKLKPDKHIIKSFATPKDPLGSINMGQAEKPMESVTVPSTERQKATNSSNLPVAHDILLNKSKERFSGGNTSVSGVSVKDGPARLSTENGLNVETTPAVVQPYMEDWVWVGCDLCQKWRLLPFGRRPDDLPEKWVCSMLDWLPGMNHCDISEDETTRALNAPVPEIQSHLNGSAPAVIPMNDQALGKSNQNLGGQATDGLGKTKHSLKDALHSGKRTIQLPNPKKNQFSEPGRSRSLSDMSGRPSDSTLKRCDLPQSGKSSVVVVEKQLPTSKKKSADGGVAKLIKVKGKRMPDQYESGHSKRIKPDKSICAAEREHSAAELGRMDLSLRTPGSSTDIKKNKHLQSFPPREAKQDSRKRILVSIRTLGDQPQVSAGSASVDSRGEGSNSRRKRKFSDSLDDENRDGTFHHSAQNLKVLPDEISDHMLRKEKKLRISETALKESGSSDGNNKSKKEIRVMRDLFGSDFADCAEDFNVDKDQKRRKARKKLQSAHDLTRGNGRHEEVPLAAASSSSKVSGSQKMKGNNEEVKGSPVESVSSSPMRVSSSVKFRSVGSDVRGKGNAATGDFLAMEAAKKSGEEKASSGNKIPVKIKKEKVSGGYNSESVRCGTEDYRDRGANYNFTEDAKPTSGLGTGHLDRKGDYSQNGEFHMEKRGSSPNSYENRARKKYAGSTLFPQKQRNGSILRTKDSDMDSASDFDRDKVKAIDFSSKKEPVYQTKEQRHDSVVVLDHVAVSHEAMHVDRCSSVERNDKNCISRRGSLGNLSNGSIRDDLLKQNECDLSDGRLNAEYGTNILSSPPPKLVQDSTIGNKADSLQLEMRSGKSMSFLRRNDDGKQQISTHDSLPEGLQQGLCIESPPDASGHSGPLKAMSKLGIAGKKKGAYNSSGCATPEHHELKDVASSPLRANFSIQTAASVLKEAKDLRNYGDRLKSSGFGFESNEACFQAALKFLQGASLLETCNGDGGKHGEMTLMQVYNATAKLCESSACEFEKSREMGAAALAYKCMEVAYMRVVYCKYSSLSRDRHELQATLQMVPQGESPSSSASDVDNLNNQAALDKPNLLKGAASHAVGNQIVAARNRPTITRLLDFTFDVNCAMEASRKSQVALAAATANLEEAQNIEQVTCIKRVIDFSFQDIDELLRLVQLAREAISRSGINGARD
ncbi:cysteine-tryptophan domain-containing zinc finger protein 7-like isoform X2 [Syzygium oleosum]|uniref:cysteine-tryptophan domain-containing zinc finger protein 7-like isoform X2 n=1 Tax=Syzygium oleosum TaxID=219896 RepID=UPI0024B89F1E|nr:cysteine-tryptophan domain-containing zinc finger protein 7-like isoform X2 [Syzygium oleosum]